MPSQLPPVSPQLPFVYHLDKPESALQDLLDFNQEHISIVMIGAPDKIDLILKLLNAFCSEPTADDRLRAIWVEEGPCYDAVKEALEKKLTEVFPNEPVEGIRAYTTVAGSHEPFEFLRKGPLTFNGITIKQAINRAVINSPAPNAEPAES